MGFVDGEFGKVDVFWRDGFGCWEGCGGGGEDGEEGRGGVYFGGWCFISCLKWEFVIEVVWSGSCVFVKMCWLLLMF